jgi:hypothetical protein
MEACSVHLLPKGQVPESLKKKGVGYATETGPLPWQKSDE